MNLFFNKKQVLLVTRFLFFFSQFSSFYVNCFSSSSSSSVSNPSPTSSISPDIATGRALDPDHYRDFPGPRKSFFRESNPPTSKTSSSSKIESVILSNKPEDHFDARVKWPGLAEIIDLHSNQGQSGTCWLEASRLVLTLREYIRRLENSPGWQEFWSQEINQENQENEDFKSWKDVSPTAFSFMKDHIVPSMISAIGLMSVHWNRSTILTATQKRDDDGHWPNDRI